MLADRLPEEDDTRAAPPIQELDYSATRARETWEVTPAYPVATEKKLFRPLVHLRQEARAPVGEDRGGPHTERAVRVQPARGERRSTRCGGRRWRRGPKSERPRRRTSACWWSPWRASGESRRPGLRRARRAGRDGRLTVLVPVSPGPAGSPAGEGYGLSPVLVGLAVGGVPRARARNGGWPVQLSSRRSRKEAWRRSWYRSSRSGCVPRGWSGSRARRTCRLRPGGPVLVAVHGFALGSAGPRVVRPGRGRTGLEIAGFVEITILRTHAEARTDGPVSGGYVVVARK